MQEPLFTAALLCLLITSRLGAAQAPEASPPYPPSAVLKGIVWHWDTHKTAAPGSDLWPVTWAADGHLYAAWGDGGGFGGTDSDGRVAMGFARIEGPPERMRGVNVNGGKDPEHPASYPDRGKTGGMVAIGNTLYAWVNRQDGTWPDVNLGLAWSADKGATWTNSSWAFPKGAGRIKPGTFLQYGRGYSGVPRALAGYVYFYAVRQGNEREVYLGRAPVGRLSERQSYQWFCGLRGGRPVWSAEEDRMRPVFVDPRGAGTPTVVYDAPLKRYLLTCFHTGPGQLGVFDGPQPWGPWTTVAYYEDWGGMGPEGEGLTCSFPPKWIGSDGLHLWCVFAVYGDGAKKGVVAHDRFNLVRATLQPRERSGTRGRGG